MWIGVFLRIPYGFSVHDLKRIVYCGIGYLLLNSSLNICITYIFIRLLFHCIQFLEHTFNKNMRRNCEKYHCVVIEINNKKLLNIAEL